jgi:DNA-binding NarL/FixJ family response regulator
MNRLRIALADDRPIFRKPLCMSLERESGLLVVGEAGDGLVATEMVFACSQSGT